MIVCACLLKLQLANQDTQWQTVADAVLIDERFCKTSVSQSDWFVFTDDTLEKGIGRNVARA